MRSASSPARIVIGTHSSRGGRRPPKSIVLRAGASFGFAARFRRLARLRKKNSVIEAWLRDIIAPGDARLQFARVTRQQHGEAKRAGFEGAGGRSFGGALVGRAPLPVAPSSTTRRVGLSRSSVTSS